MSPPVGGPALDRDRQQQTLDFVMEAGRLLLENGAEVFRVQQTMAIMAKSLGLARFNTYVVTNGIFASIDGEAAAQVRSVPNQDTNMDRVVGINQISRQVAQGKMDLEQASAALKKVMAQPRLPKGLQIVACGVGSACFTLMFGGQPWDSAASLVIGMILWCAHLALDKARLNKIIVKISGAALVATLALFICRAFPNLLIDKIIIGDLMPMTPGVALTTSIRDFVNGDYLSGTIRIIDALLIAGALACGVGLVLSLARLSAWGGLL